MNKVLITDLDYKHSLAAARFLSRSGFEVDGVGMSWDLSRSSRFLSKVAYSQTVFNESEIGTFLDFLAMETYSVLLPIGAKSVQLVSKYQKEIEQFCRIPVVPFQTIQMCLDKLITAKFAEKIGIKVPRTWEFSSTNQVKECASNIEFPVIIKGRHEILKRNPIYAYTIDQLFEGIEQWINFSPIDIPFPLIQEFIDGVGCGFFALYEHGTCKRVFMHRRVREMPPSGGASCCAMSIYEPDLLTTGKKLLDELGWHGVAMVEFKRDTKSNQLYLMEVNPKFWGSLDLALASGVNFPVLDVRMALGEEIGYSEEYLIGVKLNWPLNGELQHVIEKPSAAVSVLKDLIDPRVKSNIWINDPMPTLLSLYREIKYLMFALIEKLGVSNFLFRVRQQGLFFASVRTFSEVSGIPIIKFCRLSPELYIGSQPKRISLTILKIIGINAILNLRDEFEDNFANLKFVHYLHLPIVEFESPSIKQLNQGVSYIESIINDGGKVYIHCKEGISRAPTMAIAYCVSKGMPLIEAIELVKKFRPFINILTNQMNALKQFETQIVGDNA
jgi:predicted ATP-grasp superfamily ATP-dependent carboligase/protein-tyrosine phosphatase